MAIPKRIKNYKGRHALVDNVPFEMPIYTEGSQALMACFSCNYEKANALLPGNELHAFRLPNRKAVIVVTVINYLETNIGNYIEYSIGLACTHGSKPAPSLLPIALTKMFGTGQFILDLPVSSEISVKGGRGIWGMPKHQANLDFVITDEMVSSQYEKDGQFAFRVEIDRPKSRDFRIKMNSTNYSHFRNLLMSSYLYFDATAKFNLFKKAKGRLFIGDHPRTAYLRNLDINGDPFLCMFMPQANGILDDHFQCWFITYESPPEKMTEGFESVVNLGLGEEWLEPTSIKDYEKYKIQPSQE